MCKNMLFLGFAAEGLAGWKGQSPMESGFPFTGICSQPLAVSPGMWGGTSVGTVPVSLPLQALAFLNVIRLFLWAQCKDASGERKYLMPQQFFLKQKRKGYLTWETWPWSPVFLVRERRHCTGPISHPRARCPTWEPPDSHQQLSSDNYPKFLLALKLPYSCCSPWGSWDLAVEGFILCLPSFHILTPF